MQSFGHGGVIFDRQVILARGWKNNKRSGKPNERVTEGH
jgi:hypothetical protein